MVRAAVKMCLELGMTRNELPGLEHIENRGHGIVGTGLRSVYQIMKLSGLSIYYSSRARLRTSCRLGH